MRRSLTAAAIATLSGVLALGTAMTASADSLVDAILTAIDPPAAMIVYESDCGGKLTADGQAMIENLRQDEPTAAVLDSRVQAWRRQLRKHGTARKCEHVSTYLGQSYAKKLFSLSSK